MLKTYLFSPFTEYLFMQRAWYACLAITLSSTPIGVLVMLKRNSLMGEALSHGILPGIAIAYLLGGMWLPGLCIGGIIAGLLVAWLSNFISKKSPLYEDASFTALYIMFLALGILILSSSHGNMNITHLLFGSVLAVDDQAVLCIVIIACISLLILIITYRGLVLVSFDPIFCHNIKINASLYQVIFLSLVVCNLVAACQALGTLMALGIMMIPAITARLLSNRLSCIFFISLILGTMGSTIGLLLSFHLNWATGPTIILVLGILYSISFCYACTMPLKALIKP